MAYGRILGSTIAAGAPRTVAFAHALATATHCTFGVQDITVGGAAAVRTWPLIWTSAKGINTDTIQDDTVAAAASINALAVSPHSLLDVGPVVAGITRAVDAVSPFVTANRPAARSLHTGVTFTVANGAASSAAVTITHRLQTASVIVITWPTTAPAVGTVGGIRPMVVVQNVGAATATTCELQAQTQDNAANNTGLGVAVTFDIMVLARATTAAPWSCLARRHLTAAGVAGDDYDAGDLAQAGTRPSHAALYTNIGGLAVAPGAAYTHNLGSLTNVIVLFEQTVAVGAAKNTLYVINNGTSETTATLARLDELAGVSLNVRAAIFRPYSIVSL